MGQMEDMAMFVRIVEAGGIGKAAEQLNIAKSAVSRRLNALESRLATQLLSRTTRTSSLTETGKQYYQRAKNIVEEVSQLNEETSGEKANIAGTLRLAAPLSFSLMHLGKVIDEFANEHSRLNFQIDFSDQQVNLIEQGIELAIRIGELQDSSLQARRITSIRHVLCASPGYLEKYGTPQSIAALQGHTLLQYGLSSSGDMRLTGEQGKRQRVAMHATIKANNGDFLRAMAVSGHGIVYLPTFIVYQELRQKKLITILPELRLPVMHAYAVYPKNRFLSQRCRLFIDFICERFGDHPYWDQ